MKKHFALIDKPTFFGALFLLLSVVIPLVLFPQQGLIGSQSARPL
ncbi:hypothetical protein JCM19241_1028 [Vibrio ishigakensis]|uniref:Uncharacterized protein n=1 Tax=Vibrio ishigakensis TaxID=1481914 RepID=A0A0B8Q4Z6_9VIBR|nr:hypothetical protein JCM19241_1028 [Vibrio ishigakensis]